MNQQIYERISGWLDAHFDELTGELKKLVAFPSVAVYDEAPTPYGRECKKALDYTLALAEKFGMSAESCEDRCGRMGYAKDERGIDLWCHLDVVPAADGWTLTKPFEAVEKDGWLIGRGVGDNKGPAVGILFLLRAFRELGIETRHPVALCVGCDEEHGMSDVTFYSANYPAAKLSIVADGGFPVGYGEKGIIDVELVSDQPMTSISAMQAGLAHNILPDKGYMVVNGRRIEGKGISRHSAHPDGGVNAIHEMMKQALAEGGLSDSDRSVIEFFTRVNDDFIGTELGVVSEDELSGKTSCVGTMCGMTKDGRATMHINIRHCIGADAQKLVEAIRAACAQNGCHTEQEDLNGPAYFPRENPVVDALTNVFNTLTGENRQPYVMSGGTYARKLKNALVFGVGGLKAPETTMFAEGHGGAHQNDEGLCLETYKAALKILAMGVLEADALLD